MNTLKQDKIFKGKIKLQVFCLKLNDVENVMIYTELRERANIYPPKINQITQVVVI